MLQNIHVHRNVQNSSSSFPTCSLSDFESVSLALTATTSIRTVGNNSSDPQAVTDFVSNLYFNSCQSLTSEAYINPSAFHPFANSPCCSISHYQAARPSPEVQTVRGIMKSVAILSVCVLVFLVGHVQACTLNEMAPCLNAVTSGTAPTAPCCAKVATVDVTCFCNLVKNGNYPQNYVTNAVGVPAKCGGAAYNHFKGQNCAGHLIN